MGVGSERCEGCGAVLAHDTWACYWCGRTRPRVDKAPLLPPPANSSSLATGVVLAVGAIAVLLLVVSIVVMASSASRSLTLAGPTGHHPDAVPTAAPTPAGMFASPTDPGAVVDAATASTVLDTYWTTRQEALANHDVAALRSVAEGAAAEWDGSCGCTPSGAPTGDDRFSAPPQTSYPARFLAERKWRMAGDTGTQEVSDLIVFVRPSASDPWRAAIHAGAINGTPWDAVVQDPFALTPEPAQTIPPESMPDAVAAYFQSWWDRGSSPAGTTLRDAGMVQTRGTQIWAAHQTVVGQGATTTMTYRSGYADDGVFDFWGVGGPLVCGTVRWTRTDHAGTSDLVQPADRSVYPSFVPSGHYSTIELTGVRQVCATLGEQVDVQVMAGGDTTASYVGA